MAAGAASGRRLIACIYTGHAPTYCRGVRKWGCMDSWDRPTAARTLPPVDRRGATIVLPTYNRSQALRRCLEGLLACDAHGLEVDLRIVDDGSTDGTREMVAAVREQYEGPVRLHYHWQANGGCSAARNRALSMTDTDLVLFIDDDCVPRPGWIRALVEGPWDAATAAIGGQAKPARQGGVVTRYYHFIGFNDFPGNGNALDERGDLRFVGTLNAAYRRQALLDEGGFEEAFSDGGPDVDIGQRLRARGYQLRYQPEALVEHYHPESQQTLARKGWRRGYRAYLRHVTNGDVPRPTWRMLRSRLRRLLAQSLRFWLHPVRAGSLARAGVQPRFALSFAFLEWFQRVSVQVGRTTCTAAILLRREAAIRSSPALSTGVSVG